MKRALPIAFLFAGLLAATPHLSAQTPASGSQKNPAAAGQQPATPQQGGNPFPEDENSVPVMPSKDAPDIHIDAGADGASSLPAVDRDPVKSPDDAAVDNGQTSGFSSSLSGVDSMAPSGDDEQSGRHRKKGDQIEPEHQETAKEDLSVGQYYLDNKNWKAAQSRYQSALVLDPENPDVYWGLAESARHLGDFADARGYYEKVMEYDPDSHHSKDAAKTLKQPEFANLKTAGNSAAH